MAIAVGDKYQVKIFCKFAPQLSVNIRHYIITAVSNPGTEQKLCDAVSLALGSAIKPLLAGLASFFGVETQKLVGAAFVTQATSNSGIGSGSVTSDGLPGQVSGLISLRTGLPGRANRGRLFIPFPAEADNNATLAFPAPDLSYITRLATLGLLLVTLTVTTTDSPASVVTLAGQIYHRGSNSFTPATTAVGQPNWATQKRRGGYGAPNANPF